MQHVIVIGDLHLAVNPPGRRNDTYLPELLDMLDEIVERAKELNAHVCFIGDCFHHKRWSRVPHHLVDTLMQKISLMPRKVLVLPGNHDLADGSMDSLDRQPIALLRYVDNVFMLGYRFDQDASSVMAYLPEVDDDAKAAGIYVAGIAGTADVTDARPETLPFYAQRCDLLLVHGPISSRVMPWPTWQPEQLPLDCSVMVYGHQHDDARVVSTGEHDGGTTRIVASGALARGAINDADNTPSIVELGFDGTALVDIQIRPLASALPAADIYRWAEREAEITENWAMHTFVASLGAARLAGFSREGLIQKIWQRTELPEPVRKMATEILEEVAP